MIGNIETKWGIRLAKTGLEGGKAETTVATMGKKKKKKRNESEKHGRTRVSLYRGTNTGSDEDKFQVGGRKTVRFSGAGPEAEEIAKAERCVDPL